MADTRMAAPGPAVTTGVLLADDEHLVRTGLRALVNAEADLTIVGEAADGAEAVALARRLRPDVVLMDVRMPALDGIQATHRISGLPDPPRILIITVFEHDELVYSALRAGAHGFLLKRARPQEILHAIRLAAHGETLLFPAAVRQLVLRHTPPDRSQRQRQAHLTNREAAVLRLIAAGLSNAEIGHQLHISQETVQTHVSNVLTKLNARNRTQAVITAYESGFITPLAHGVGKP